MTTLICEEKILETVTVTDTPSRADHGSTSLLESIYHQYGARIYSLCLRLLADTEMAESATVQVFVLLNRESVYWWEESRLLSFLRELAIGASLSHLGEHSSVPEPPVPPSEPLSSALPVAELTLDPARLDVLITRLPDAWRISFVLHDVEGLSEAQIAARLRIDTEAVRRRVRHARLMLRQLWRSQ